MAHGLEARAPLLDHELVELVSRFPERWKLERGRPKPLLQDLVAGTFRPGFLDRPKQGFAVPLKRWIRDDVDGFFGDELRRGALARSGLVRMDTIERMLAEERAGRVQHQHRIFALVALSMFLRRR
jgi:asparagine synthase (glutamine-hydrolysing)